MGKIYIKPYKKEEEMLVEGLHPCLVSPEIFEKVQLILKGKYKVPVRTLTEIDQALPLRGFLVCPECGKLLTGSGSKGRDGKNTYFYYHCTRYCKTRHKAIEVNALFESLLCEMKIEQEQESVYTSLLSERFSERHQDKQTLIQSLKREEENLYKRIEMAEDHLFEKQIDASAFNSMKTRIDNRLSEIKIELKEMGVKERFFEKHLKEGITFLKGVDTVYKDSPTELKKKIVQTLFCQKLEYHQWYFSTPTLEESIKTILFRDRRLECLRITDKKRNAEGVVPV